MAFTYKSLGQSAPAAGALTALYTVPGATTAIIEGVTICNRSSVATSFRLALSVGGGAIADKDYLFYDAVINGNETVNYNGVLTAAAADILRCYAQDATLSFNANGVEIT